MRNTLVMLVCAAMWLAGGGASAQVYVETFACEMHGTTFLWPENSEDDTETIVRTDPGQWAWGSYFSGASGYNYMNSQWSGVFQSSGGHDVGSRLYTRFDTITDPPGTGANTPSMVWDATGSRNTVTLGRVWGDQQDIALLIRDNNTWFASDPRTVQDLSSATGLELGWRDGMCYLYDVPVPTDPADFWYLRIPDQIDFVLTEETWYPAEASAGLTDMDEVDDDGEGLVTFSSTAGSPNLDQIEGIGVMAVTAEEVPGDSAFTLGYIQIGPPWDEDVLNAIDEWSGCEVGRDEWIAGQDGEDGPTEIDCVTLSPTDLEAGGTLTVTAFDAEGVQVDLAEWTGGAEINFSEGGFFIEVGDLVDGAAVLSPITQAMLDGAQMDLYVFVADSDPWQDQWVGISMPDFEEDAPFDSVADALAAGGTCEAAEPEELLVFISGPHLVTEGQEVTLVGNVVGGEGTDCSWTLDGEPAGEDGELDLGEVTGDDEGVYVFECTVDGDPEASEDFELQIVDAVPLAGGLGLGLLAGACALAGAVIVRRSK